MSGSDDETTTSGSPPSQDNSGNVQEEVENTVKYIEGWNKKRMEVFETIDNAKFGFFHIRACLVAGAGFFTDAYDLFAINLVSNMLSYIYYRSKDVDLGLKISANSGTLVGQLAFGILADHLGRKKMYGVELFIIIAASSLSALSAPAHSINVFGVLIFWRIILGIGIGGDYPLSAIITSEFAATKYRGKMMAIVFAMQGLGILFSILVAVVALAAARSTIIRDRGAIDTVWRIVLGIGALPGVIALYFRLTIPETPRYRVDIERNVYEAENDIRKIRTPTDNDGQKDQRTIHVNVPRPTIADFKNYFGRWSNGKILLGTCGAWFCIDVAFYGLGLNNSIFIRDLNLCGTHFASNRSAKNLNAIAYSDLWCLATANAYLTLLGTIPGYLFTIALIDKWGRKPIQFTGFGVLAVIFFVLGGAFDKLKDHVKAFYCLLFISAQFFSNFGPNSTTFIIPGEVFPTRYRSTAYGISAASGKLGAVLAQVIFIKVGSIGIKYSLLICAIFMVSGIGFTCLIPETKEETLEHMSNENQEEFAKSES